jgi:hypothetical protein
MFVETDGLVVVTVQQAFPMQLGFVDETREVDVAAQLFIRTPRMRLSLQRRD